MKTKKIPQMLFFIILLVFITMNIESCKPQTQNTTTTTTTASDYKNDKANGLRFAMRKLWVDHIIWTRNVILNIIDGVTGTDEALNRLLKNQDDIGDAIKPYYGSDAGKQLSALLRAHITIAGDLLKALKKDDDKGVEDANKKWIANADEIAVFLSKANPNWTESEMETMMHSHLSLTTDEAVARKKKDYAGDIKAYDKVHDQILEMADMLSNGIIKQFPEKF